MSNCMAGDSVPSRNQRDSNPAIHREAQHRCRLALMRFERRIRARGTNTSPSFVLLGSNGTRQEFDIADRAHRRSGPASTFASNRSRRIVSGTSFVAAQRYLYFASSAAVGSFTDSRRQNERWLGRRGFVESSIAELHGAGVCSASRATLRLSSANVRESVRILAATSPRRAAWAQILARVSAGEGSAGTLFEDFECEELS